MDLQANKAGTYPIWLRPPGAVGLSTPPVGCVLGLPGLPGGGNKIYDRSPYGNNITIVGATWKRLPSGLWYLYFDGLDDYLRPGNALQYDITGKISLGAWVSLDALGSNNTVIARDDATANRNFLLYVTSSNKVEFIIWSGGVLKYDDTPMTFTAGEWHLVGGTYDRITVKAFLDGVKGGVVEDACTGDIDNNDVPLEIGSRETSGTMRLAGGIALPFLSNFAMSDLQWQEKFNREKHLFGRV